MLENAAFVSPVWIGVVYQGNIRNHFSSVVKVSHPENKLPQEQRVSRRVELFSTNSYSVCLHFMLLELPLLFLFHGSGSF